MKKSVIFLISIIIFFVLQLNVFACVCVDLGETVEQGVKSRLKNSKAIFVGKVITSKENSYIKFEVEKTWTEFRPKEVTLFGESYDCAYPFEVGKKYLVYAYERQGILTTDTCQWNREIEKAEEQLKVLGEGKMPEDEPKEKTIPTSLQNYSDIPNRKWWKEAVVYQIYPRSFKDSDGDGVGDLKGIISKLDYIKSLGVDVIWLNPIFTSPNDDNGYDVSDYRGIMKEFGTMQDFDDLLKGLHRRKIKLILDLVANHSSDEHEWFKQARSSRSNPYRNYYHWWNAEKGKPPFRRSFFDVNNDAWKYDEKTNSYYLHYYSVKQPDLNWENPKVRQEIYDVMRFWLAKGIDGFRMDVIPFISKDTAFPEIPEDKRGQLDTRAFYANGPHLHDYLQEMNREILSKYDIMTVGEGSGVTLEQVSNFIDPDRHELNMLYHFDGRNIPYLSAKTPLPEPNFDLLKFKNVYSKWDKTFNEKGWGTIYLGNHDVPRMVSRWGNDAPEYRDLSSKMLSTFLLTMSGTPYYFAGDELGMTNIKFDRAEDYRDIKTVNRIKEIQSKGGDLRAYLDDQKIISRDNARTPFQWNDSANAGFSNATPWLKINPNYKAVNVAAEEKDRNSTLNYFRKLIALRKKDLTLVYGKYTLLDETNLKVYAYTRELNGRKLLILLNFTQETATVNTGFDLDKAKVLLGNYSVPSSNNQLKAYEAVIFEL